MLTDGDKGRLFKSGLCRLAEDLRGQHTGTSELWDDQEINLVAQYLRWRLETWRPSAPVRERYDDAVRTLIKASLAECKL